MVCDHLAMFVTSEQTKSGWGGSDSVKEQMATAAPIEIEDGATMGANL